MAQLHLTYGEPGLPLLRLLKAEAEDAGLRVVDNPVDLVERHLAEMETDIAMVSPLAYGQRETDLALLPGACIAAVGATGDTLLHFRAGLKEFRTLAYAGEVTMDLLLTQIVLKEKYGMEPALIRVSGTVEAMLAQADAALVLGAGSGTDGDADAASRARPGDDELEPSWVNDTVNPNAIDVVDEWFDMTELPFVRLLLAGWETRLDTSLLDLAARAGEAADRESLTGVDRAMYGRSALAATDIVPGHYRYRITEEVMEGLNSFFRFAFYHGLHRDIPQFRYWTAESGEGSPGTIVDPVL